MSLNKTRKRAIARARGRPGVPAQELLSGYTPEQIIEGMRSIGLITQAIIDGAAAFGKAFNESMKKQSEERT